MRNGVGDLETGAFSTRQRSQYISQHAHGMLGKGAAERNETDKSPQQLCLRACVSRGAGTEDSGEVEARDAGIQQPQRLHLPLRRLQPSLL